MSDAAEDAPSPDAPAPTARERAVPLPSGGRLAFWVLAGLAFPCLAFAVDSSLRINPLLWQRGPGRLPPDAGLGLRPFTVYALIGLSMLGLLLSLVRPRSRAAVAASLPLLLLGVLLACAHAIVFVPLLPISVMGILAMGLGLLGLTPFLALAVYVDALRWALRRQARLSHGRLRWATLPLLGTALLLVAAVHPLWRQEQALRTIRLGKDAAAVSKGLRQLGGLTERSRAELRSLYPDLDAGGQVRLRNLYLERFGADVHDELRLRRGS